ncbi:MAG: hypothetical protein ACRCZF_21870, partial [Gemmataceae bacterium]
MYSLLMMAALSTAPQAPEFNGFFKKHFSGGSSASCSGNCSGGGGVFHGRILRAFSFGGGSNNSCCGGTANKSSGCTGSSAAAPTGCSGSMMPAMGCSGSTMMLPPMSCSGGMAMMPPMSCSGGVAYSCSGGGIEQFPLMYDGAGCSGGFGSVPYGYNQPNMG